MSLLGLGAGGAVLVQALSTAPAWWPTVIVGAIGVGLVAFLGLRIRRLSRRRQGLERRVAAMTEELDANEELLSRVNEELAEMVVERDRRSRRLEEARSRAEAASRAKTRFLTNMSHELRTPLNSVIGFADYLLKNKDGRFGERDLLFLGKISDNGRHLLTLIDQILDLAKIESGHVELEMAAGWVGDVVREVVEQLEGQTLDRPVSLEVDIPGETRPISMDPARLKQVLINLIGNGLKFTDEGVVTVAVRTDRHRRPTCVEVIDDGIGIADDDLASIFDAFEQADTSTTRIHGGTGLGLALSRSLCHLMGYGLEAESEVGVGSTFRVTFPSGPRIEKEDGDTRRTPPPDIGSTKKRA